MRLILVWSLAILMSLLSMQIGRADTLKSSGNIMIFISFSMPEKNIKEWLQQAELIHAPVIIRGLVNNSFKDTIKKMSQFTNDNHGGVQLDPTLFQRYQITKVPAVVIKNTSECLPNQTCEENYDVIYGNITLSYALKKVAAQNDFLSPMAQDALNEMKGRYAN